MKPRRVLVTLEIETDQELRDLKNHEWWNMHGLSNYWRVTAWQAQANVIKPEKKKRARP